MIGVVFDSMMKMLVAKFMLNDIPHAANIVATTSWARNLAKGQLKAFGITPDDPNYEEYVRKYALKVAIGMVENE